MRHAAAAVLAVLLHAGVARAAEWSVTSPDGRRSVAVTLGPAGGLTWRATSAGAMVIADSPLGIRRADQPFLEGLKAAGASEAVAVEERYETPHGKRRLHHVRGRERTLAFANASGARVEVVIRAHDDGVAFRYRFPERDGTARTVVEERTGFRLPAGSTGWLLPHHMPSRYKPAYEDLYASRKAVDRAKRNDFLEGTLPVRNYGPLIRKVDAEKAAKKLRKPTLVMVAELDVVVGVWNSRNVYKALAAPDKEYIVIPKSGHSMAGDHQSAVVLDHTRRWLDAHLRSGGA